MHPTEINIAVPKCGLACPRIADFMKNLNRIDGLAHEMPDFVWMLKDYGGNATAIETPWPGDVISNLSVWESPERLDHLETHGGADQAFGCSHPPHVKCWQRCG